MAVLIEIWDRTDVDNLKYMFRTVTAEAEQGI